MYTNKETARKYERFVDPQGFEPQMTEPKSVVLPLHHGSLFYCGANLRQKFYFASVFKKNNRQTPLKTAI